jgi:general secretion pathway protein G
MKINTSRQFHQAGYTLLEIMLVVGIIILLLGAAVFKLMGNMEAAQIARVRADLSTFTTQLKTFETLMLRPPTQQEGLKALVERPTSGPKLANWRPLLDSMPLDPWGNAYTYTYPAKRSKAPYDLGSWGPDRLADTEDDLGNWE